jgi:hypothetical protein
MPPPGPHHATTAPRPELPEARLVLGAAAAAVWLFLALHSTVLPGDRVSLDQKNRRTESIAALEPATRAGSHRTTAAGRATGARPAHERRAVAKTRRQQASKTAPRTAGKQIATAPGTKQTGSPAASDPPASGGDPPVATETPPADQSSPSPPPSPPPSSPRNGLPDAPRAPQLPAPGARDLPKPQAPTVPTPQAPAPPAKQAAKSSASFSPPLPHTDADTRTEEAGVGKQSVPASADGGTPSTRRGRGGPS